MAFTNHCDLPADNEMALQNAIAADLFPRCAHVETVVTLQKSEG